MLKFCVNERTALNLKSTNSASLMNSLNALWSVFLLYTIMKMFYCLPYIAFSVQGFASAKRLKTIEDGNTNNVRAQVVRLAILQVIY